MAHNGACGIYYIGSCRVTRGAQWSAGHVVLYYVGLQMAHSGALDVCYILRRVTHCTQRNAGRVVYTM